MLKRYVLRYVIKGHVAVIKKIMKKHFYKESLRYPTPKRNFVWKSQGLMEEDPLEKHVLNSGEFECKATSIEFSSYMDWDVRYVKFEQMAKKLPKNSVLFIAGLLMDDVLSSGRSFLYKIEGKTGKCLEKEEDLSSKCLAQKVFPLLYLEALQERDLSQL